MNGGTCFFNNVCQCPENFAGNHCQYSFERCSPKRIGFNGGYKCSGTQFDLSCSISCPPGINIEYPPAESYSCNFESGVFTPSKIPKCIYGKSFNKFILSR